MEHGGAEGGERDDFYTIFYGGKSIAESLKQKVGSGKIKGVDDRYNIRDNAVFGRYLFSDVMKCTVDKYYVLYCKV